MPSTIHRYAGSDARDMTSLPEESVHLILTSPPYPMIQMWDEQFAALNPRIEAVLQREEGREAFELMHQELDKAWAESHRVLVPGGFICINIGDAARSTGGNFGLFPNHARILSSAGRLGFQVLPLILWRKQTNAPNKFMGSGMLPAGAYVTLEHEYILVLRKGGKRVFASQEDRRNRQESALFWEERNRWYSDVWDFKGARQALGTAGARSRSAAFPFELAYRLTCMFSCKQDTVLDPFLGTGTTMQAAAALERNSAGFELDESLADSALEGAAGAGQYLN
ncbi:MAG: site-specific DNA-methyltransferase, partial [Spirochaetales bacterium]